MTRIEFRIVEPTELHSEACRLARQAADYGQQVFILCDTEAESAELQAKIQRNGVYVAASATNVATFDKHRKQLSLGHHAAFANNATFINLHQHANSLAARFKFAYDLIGNDEAQREQARDRYRFYRDRGYALSTLNRAEAHN